MKSWTDEKKKIWALEDAHAYDKGIGEYVNQRENALIRSWIAHSRLLLDLPCGSGRFLGSLRGTVVSADYAIQMVRMSASRGVKRQVVCDAFHLPFKESRFDGVLCMRLVFHYPETEELLAELRRVLAPKGILVIDTLNQFSLRYALQLVIRPFRARAKELQFHRPKRFRQQAKGWSVKGWDAMFLLPTRVYRHVPKFLLPVLRIFEMCVPKGLRTVSYWKLERI